MKCPSVIVRNVRTGARLVHRSRKSNDKPTGFVDLKNDGTVEHNIDKSVIRWNLNCSRRYFRGFLYKFATNLWNRWDFLAKFATRGIQIRLWTVGTYCGHRGWVGNIFLFVLMTDVLAVGVFEWISPFQIGNDSTSTQKSSRLVHQVEWQADRVRGSQEWRHSWAQHRQISDEMEFEIILTSLSS